MSVLFGAGDDKDGHDEGFFDAQYTTGSIWGLGQVVIKEIEGYFTILRLYNGKQDIIRSRRQLIIPPFSLKNCPDTRENKQGMVPESMYDLNLQATPPISWPRFRGLDFLILDTVSKDCQ